MYQNAIRESKILSQNRFEKSPRNWKKKNIWREKKNQICFHSNEWIWKDVTIEIAEIYQHTLSVCRESEWARMRELKRWSSPISNITQFSHGGAFQWSDNNLTVQIIQTDSIYLLPNSVYVFKTGKKEAV